MSSQLIRNLLNSVLGKDKNVLIITYEENIKKTCVIRLNVWMILTTMLIKKIK